MKSRVASASSPKVVTASDLLEGDVVYLAGSGDWTRWLAEAELIFDQSVAESRLDAALAQPDRVVGPYLADMQAGPAGPKPVHVRETLRSAGPTNHVHGKQENAPRA